MASFAVVMLTIILIINFSNFNGMRLQLNAILDYLVSHDGIMPAGINPGELEDAGAIFNEEFRYTTRYFTVILNEEKRPTAVNTTHIAAIDKETAISYAKSVLEHGGNFGAFTIRYYYKREHRDDGSWIVVFLDASTQLRSLRRLSRASGLIFIGGLFILFWPVWIFSGKQIEPELENIGRQNRFITNASHELKTPLAVIRANTELEEMINGENEWTQSTLKQIERLEGLITNLVTMARASENRDEVVMRETDISVVIREEVDEFASVAEKHGKTLVSRLSSPYIFKTDTDRLKQLVRILVDNAIKYCDEGGRIEVVLKKKGRTAVMTVSNSYAEGKGQDFSRFFDRFYRQDSSHNTEKGGYGIGLAIAYDLVKALRGRIDVSWKNGFITFTSQFTG